MKQPYDPKLREAMEEIKPILKKYDCMATVILASPSKSEFLFQPTASWTVSRWEGDPVEGKLRFRSKREDFESKEAQDAATEATVHGIESIRWLSLKMHENMNQLVEMLREHMSIMTNVAGFMGKPDSVPGDGK
jgi:hypothetical protein